MRKILGVVILVVGLASSQNLDLNVKCGLGTDITNQTRITGGRLTRKGDWGWMALINGGGIRCGGSLINNQYVVTAAHCVSKNQNPEKYSVSIGLQKVYAPDDWSVTKLVKEIIVHRSYDTVTGLNDIALLKLDTPVEFDNANYKVFPICVPNGLANYNLRTAWIAGYGNTFSGTLGVLFQYTLRQAQVQTLTKQECFERFKSNADYQVCTYSDTGSDACTGDSGSPLMVKGRDELWHLVGIFTRGTCGQGSVYTRISSYINWIKETVMS